MNKLIAEADGNYAKSQLEADAYFQQQEQIAQAILAEGKAEADGIRAMNRALTGSGGETLVKLRIAEALQDPLQELVRPLRRWHIRPERS